jgi:dolichol kinase
MSFINLQKHYQVISVIFLLGLIASFFVWPERSGYFAIAILILGFGMSLALIIKRNYEANTDINLMRTMVNRKIAVEVLGLLLVILVASFAGYFVGAWAGSAVEQSQPGFGMYAGLTAGMASALGAAWGMRMAWNKAASIIMSE